MPDICNLAMRDQASDTSDFRTIVGHASVDAKRKARASAMQVHVCIESSVKGWTYIHGHS